MLDPHTSSELSIDEIIRLCDDLIELTLIPAEISLITEQTKRRVLRVRRFCF